MKTLVLLLITLSFSLHSADARLGESLDQMKVRYGNPVPKLFQGKVVFSKGGLHILTLIHQQKCVQISFFREDGELLPDEVLVLLKANAKGLQWFEVKGTAQGEWETKDKELRAILSSNFLTITDVKGLAAYEEAKSKEGAAKLKGF